MLWPCRLSWAAQQLIDLEYQWAVRGDPRIADPPSSPEPPQLLYLDDNATRTARGLQECAPCHGRHCAWQLAGRTLVSGRPLHASQAECSEIQAMRTAE